MPSRTTTLRLGAAVLAAATGLSMTAIPASAAQQTVPDGPALARQLVKKVSITGLNRHLVAFQRIADRSGGNRAAGAEGHEASAEYVATKLEAAGYTVTRQEFPFVYDETEVQTATVDGVDLPVARMAYSQDTPAGGVTGPLVVVPPDATPGCEASDYEGLAPEGAIVLVRRGSCPFADKALVAAEVGAAAVIIYNNVPGALNGTLGGPNPDAVPAAGVTQEQGAALAEQAGATVTLDLQGVMEDRSTYNVIAETQTGRANNVVMAGAHLDSVGDGAGINDNGTGSAALLETALQLGGSPRVNNKVRFAWWGAEEHGLVGSEYYVQNLDFEAQLDIALYLNFDMIGSPNAGYFIFDGDNSDGVGAGEGPYGSGQIEAAFANYFEATGVPTEGTDFNGRSDYNEFIVNGIPAGGLFTGGDMVKTEAQVDKWGGTAGITFDPCYHSRCDNLGNVDRVAFDRMADGAAWVIASYGISTEDVNGVPPRQARAKARVAEKRAMATEVVADPEHAAV
ncbi:M28 family metallopeptidase [Actinophytocola xanthii]|uniref:Amidohydrolase n=1 Tax=Actinophytocola xanthii TaxID=1912961 RepID=A0A1Q8BSI5_9PSEU|nr:M28 family metallopeptidase [Actinophytocola xanthii]OLF05069.1 amidohydrolase [Actinophytocola xanthii]